MRRCRWSRTPWALAEHWLAGGRLPPAAQHGEGLCGVVFSE